MNFAVCPQDVQPSFMLKHIDFYSQGVGLNSAEISIMPLHLHLHCLLHWPVMITFLKDSRGHFFKLY